jgi:fructose-1,6-bisphosphatase I
MTIQPNSGPITTIERYILDRQERYPDASGALTEILQDLALAGKLIASHTTRAGLVDILGATGDVNVQGEMVQKLDAYSHDTIYRLLAPTGRLSAMVSEEEDEMMIIPGKSERGRYVLMVDPLDGSSNIDFNVSVGTVFAVFKRKSVDGPPVLEDALQKGTEIVAAGYIVYASSTMLVYSAGDGVHGFTLDPGVGEFLLSHPNIRIPEKPKYYSANLGREPNWHKGIQKYSNWLQGEQGNARGLSLRYIGSMVADVHRTLLSGGVFYYPSDPGNKGGKLRLMYEAIPMAFIIEQAGGSATDGINRILDIQPEHIHQRTPFFAGSKDLVEKAAEFIKSEG